MTPDTKVKVISKKSRVFCDSLTWCFYESGIGGQRYVQNLSRSPPASVVLDACHGQQCSPLNAWVPLLSTPPPPTPP